MYTTRLTRISNVANILDLCETSLLVSHALLAKQSDFIKWPTGAELVVNKNAFYRRGRFPCVIGCVDGTHIRIQAPKDHENAYVNRKGFHSINVQGMCDHEGQ